jgi:DNA-binding IclR family transcriptional regulator
MELIASNANGFTLTEICEKINAPKSSMFPIIHTLEERGYLSQNPANMRYKISQMAFQIGNAYLDYIDITDEVQRELQNIVNICGETCLFAILSGSDVFYLKKVDSPQAIRMIAMVGKKIPAYGTGLGKALLSAHKLADLRRLYPEGLQPLTENTITDINVLYEQLQKAKVDGFAYEMEESNQFVRCIAIPLHQNEKIVAAISVAIPTFRYSSEKESLIKHLLLNTKSKLESILSKINVDFSSLL